MFRVWIDCGVIWKSGYFDPAYFLQHYPEYRPDRKNLFWHIVSKGWKEGCNSSSKIDTFRYLKTNLDVEKARVNPLVHYVQHDRWEGWSTMAGEALDSVAYRKW